MKTMPIVTEESKSLCHPLILLRVDDVPDAKRRMHRHSTDTLRENGQVVIPLAAKTPCCSPRQVWDRYALLKAMSPFLTEGSMIEFARMEGSTYTAPPQRFETDVSVATQAVGRAAACDCPTRSGMPRVNTHERALTQILLASLAKRSWVRVSRPVDCQDHSGVVDGVRA